MSKRLAGPSVTESGATPAPEMPPPDRPGEPEAAAPKKPRRSLRQEEPVGEPDDEVGEPEDLGGTGEEEDDVDQEIDQAEKEYERGYGVGVRSPDIGRVRRASASKAREFSVERPLDMSSMEDHREGPLGVENEEVEALARKLAAVGTNLRMSVTRLYPDDVPPSERGPHQWIDIPHASPESVIEQIKSRFGGGRFEIIVCDRNPEERHRAVKTIVDIGGDVIPFTLEGRNWFRRHYGEAALLAAGPLPTGPDGKPVLPPVTSMDSAGGVLQTFLQLQAAQDARRAESADKDKDRESSLAAAVIQSLAPRQNTGLLQALAALAPVALEFVRSMREDARRERDEREKRFHELIVSQRPQQPVEIMEAFQNVLKFQGQRLNLEMETYKKNQDRLMDEAIKALRTNGKEEDATVLGSIASALRESAPDLLRGIAPVITGMMRGQSAAQAAQGAGFGVDPRLVAARGPMQPRPMNPMTSPTQPQPLPSAPAAPPAAPAVPAPEVETAASPAPEGGESVLPETASPDQDAQQHPEDFVGAASLAALHDWIYHARGFSGRGVDPDAAWGWVSKTRGPTAGNTIEVIYGLTPVIFRKRVEETDPGKPYSVEAWVAGGPEPILAMAKEFDEFLTANVAAREWLSEFLACGPWAEDVEEDAE